MDVLEQIFKETQYACVAGVQSPRVIFDLGANVGYASAYFLSRFPAAEVMAVEPDPGNYEICCKNLSPYGPRARVILGAVWSHRRKLVLLRGAYRDGREWTTQVLATDNPDDAATVDAWDIPSLLKLAGHNHIDILKVDIERSDVELFSNGSRQWLPNVRNMCIELHDEDCERAFFGALQDYEFDLSRSGELTVCLNLRPRLNGSQR
jgi:FkbM family methyltransferase